MRLKTGDFSRLSDGYLGRGPLAHLAHSRCEVSRFLSKRHEMTDRQLPQARRNLQTLGS
jgi:hypothetical protein